MSKTIKADLHLSQNEVANSNVISLVATLVVRLIAGPLCDRYVILTLLNLNLPC